MLIVFLIFIIGRFACSKCEAQIDKEDVYVSEQRYSYVLGIWLLGILILGSLSVTMVGNIGSLQASENS
jgi:hypothetical protein